MLPQIVRLALKAEVLQWRRRVLRRLRTCAINALSLQHILNGLLVFLLEHCDVLNIFIGLR